MVAGLFVIEDGERRTRLEETTGIELEDGEFPGRAAAMPAAPAES